MVKHVAKRLVTATYAVLALQASAWAVSYELRGVGTLPSFGTPPVGVVGENITVSVLLNSDDFDYETVANPIFHYFVPNKTVPVKITGSITGEYPNISPISRFVALELTNDPGGSKDQLGLDTESGNASTSLFDIYANDRDGFDGNVTPFNSTDLFAILAEAMAKPTEWTRTSISSAMIGNSGDSLYLGNLNWSLVSPNAPPTQQMMIAPAFDVQLKPGNAYPLGNATTPTLDIDGGSGTSYPVLDVLMDFPLGGVPAGADILSAKLKLDATTSSTMTIQALGYVGDGLAALTDEFAATTLIGSKNATFSAAGDIVIDLDANYIESLLAGTSHLGLRLKSATAGPYIRFATKETSTGVPPALVLEYVAGISGDYNNNGTVDAADYVKWRNGGPLANEFDTPGTVNAADYAAWRARFGNASGAGAGVGSDAAGAAVPEPTAAMLIAMAIMCVAWNCRNTLGSCLKFAA